jgi:two-component sensor histidine kinase
VLYQSGNLNSMPFNSFLDKLLETLTMQEEIDSNQLSIKTDGENVFLTINQSIPCGLFLTELLSLIFEFTDSDSPKDLNILFREYGKNVHIIVEGKNIINCPKQLKESTSLHNVLLETLVEQLQGNLLWPNPESSHQKFELIFTKKNGSGPAHNLLN